MGLNPNQQNAFDALKEKMPTDLVPGYSIASTGTSDPESVWMKNMSKFSKDLGANAYAYFNYDLRNKKGIRRMRRKPRKIISADGFPPWVTVSYAYPPPFAFYTGNASGREIKHFVMHSFGHGWHSTIRKGKKIGWMNSSRRGRGVIPIEYEGKTIYISKGSDPESMAHFTRFSAGLRTCLNSAAKATAHFFIDRAGNLVVVGDCNDVMFTSQGISKTSCGVEMEEAFYVLKDTKGKKSKAIWKPGGKPPGTAGNIEYFAYSPQQMLTLSILCKKLELMFPRMKERNVFFKRRAFTRAQRGGYTIHDFINKSHHIDVSPHFLDQGLWDAFFDLIDTHTHINPTNCFKPRQKWSDGGQSVMAEPVSDTDITAMTDRMLQYAKDRGMAFNRSALLANTKRSSMNDSSGNNATKKSHKVSEQVGDTNAMAQQTQNPAQDTPNDYLPVSEEGYQVGSDDMW